METESSPGRFNDRFAKLEASKIEENDNNEIPKATRSAEARTEGLFFVFIVGVRLESPEFELKTDIYYAFLPRLECWLQKSSPFVSDMWARVQKLES